MFAALTELYANNVDPEFVPKKLRPAILEGRNQTYMNKAEMIYDNTMFVDQDKLMTVLNMPAAEAIEMMKNDPAFRFAAKWKTIYDTQVSSPYNEIKFQIDSLQRIYMKALMETFPDQRFYPDANSTLRVTYGKVNGYEPMDAVKYEPVTYLDGVMEKYKPGDYEFDVDEKLISFI